MTDSVAEYYVLNPTKFQHELDYICLVRDFATEVTPNPNEVADVRKVDRQALDRLFNDQDTQFSPWFRLIYESGWLTHWWKSLDSHADVHDFAHIYKLS